MGFFNSPVLQSQAIDTRSVMLFMANLMDLQVIKSGLYYSITIYIHTYEIQGEFNRGKNRTIFVTLLRLHIGYAQKGRRIGLCSDDIFLKQWSVLSAHESISITKQAFFTHTALGMRLFLEFSLIQFLKPA